MTKTEIIVDSDRELIEQKQNNFVVYFFIFLNFFGCPNIVFSSSIFILFNPS